MSADYAVQRHAMVTEQLARRGIADSRVLAAFGRVERQRYIPEDQCDRAYADHPLPIGSEQTISQPYVVAFMLAQLGLQGGERVLEIGTGSGYQTALLAELAAEVYTVEYFPPLAAQARNALTAAGYDGINYRIGDGRQGWPDAAPFDAIICSAAPAAIPAPLVGQLAMDGQLILPLGVERQHLILVRRDATGLRQQSLLPVRFVPMQ